MTGPSPRDRQTSLTRRTGTCSRTPPKPARCLTGSFRDLGIRVGIVQPRSAIAKHKHIELQADTLRVLALSLLADEQVLTMTSFAERMWSTWSFIVGAGAQDGDLLRSSRFGPVERDDDLRPNAIAFEALLIQLGLAVEPSDGLTLVAINAEELI